MVIEFFTLSFYKNKILFTATNIQATPPFIMRMRVDRTQMERWREEFHRVLQRPHALALDTRYFPLVAVLLFLLDVVATAGIIWKVPCELLLLAPAMISMPCQKLCT